LFLGSPIDWPFLLIKAVIGLKPDLSVLTAFYWVGQLVCTIWGFIIIDFYESMSKYLLHDVLTLLGDNIDVYRFRQQIKRVVFVGMLWSMVLGLLFLFLFVFFWQRFPLFDRITFPLRLIWSETSWLMIYCIFPGGIWAICELLKSNTCGVIDLAMEVVVNLQDIQKASNELNARMTKFSQTFQRPLVNLIIFYVMCLLSWPLNEFVWVTFHIITVIQIVFLLYALAMLAAVVAKHACTIDERLKENDECLPLQKAVDALKFCGIRITETKIWGFFTVFVVLTTILRIVLLIIV